MATKRTSKRTKETKVAIPTVDVDATRVANVRERIVRDRKTRIKLIDLINKITEELSLDEEKMAKRIDSAITSEYGPINGLINLLVAIAKWPVAYGDGANVGANRRILESKFNLDLVMLSELAELRGYHSFVTDELEVVEGKEPDYVNYGDYCQVFLEDLDAEGFSRTSIEPVAWRNKETKAKVKAEATVAERIKAIEEYKNTLSK